MGRRFFSAIALLVLAGASLRAQPDTITLVHVGDSHSRLAPWGPRNSALEAPYGGIARLATAVGMIRANAPNPVAVHTGDFFIGDLFFNKYFGIPELRILAALGFDALALGNHEFDLGPGVLKMVLDSGLVMGGPDVVCANCGTAGLSATGLDAHVVPFTVVERSGHKVGIFGMTTPSANLTSQPAPVFIDTLLPQIAGAIVDTLRKLGCDVVIMASHLGYRLDRVVAAYVPGINVILGGHDHRVLTQPEVVTNPSGQQTLIAHVGSHYARVGRMTLVIDGGAVSMAEYAQIPLDGSVPEAPPLKAAVDGMIAGIEETYGPVFSQQIAYCAEDIEESATQMTQPGAHDTPLGNHVTNAYRLATGSDLAIQPGGSMADKLYRGPIVPVDVFRAIGYGFDTIYGLGFRVVKVTMPGVSLLGGIEFGLSEIELDDEYLLQVSGMRYAYKPAEAPGSRLAWAKRYQEVDDRRGRGGSEGEKLSSRGLFKSWYGIHIDPSATYTVATNELAVMFLDMLGLPYYGVEYLPGYLTEFQVLVDYFSRLGTIRAMQDGRVRALGPGGTVEQEYADPDLLLR